MYEKMCEALTLYYLIMNVYEDAQGSKSAKGIRKTWAGLKMDDVFLQVSVFDPFRLLFTSF